MHLFAQSATSRGQSALLGAVLALGVAFGSLALALPSAQAAAPTGFTSQTYADADANGTIDRLVVVINGGEALDTCTVTAGELATDWTYVGGATFGGTLASATCDTATATITFVISGATANVTGGGTAPTIAYDNDDADNSISNTTGDLGSVVAASAADGAAPVVVSVSPAAAATGVLISADLVVTFSEPMVTDFDYGTEFSASPVLTNLTFTDTWSAGNTVVTLSHTPNMVCGRDYTITLDSAGAIDASAGSLTNLVTTGPEDGVWAFETKSCGRGEDEDGSYTPPAVYGLTVTSPNGGESVQAGSPLVITWANTTTNGSLPYVNLSYSLNGQGYTIIATNVSNTGSYEWEAPDTSGTLLVKVEGTDLATVLASDISDAAATVTGGVTGEESPTDIPEDTTDGDLSHLPAGSFIKGESFTSVYYVGTDGKRHPFMTSTIFFTWEDSFEDVVTLSDETLATYKLGSPMLPKARTVLVKLESMPEVYLVGEDSTLHWISSEEVARVMAGANWSDYVIDLPITLWTKFTVGDDVTTANSDIGTTLDLRTRAWLSAQTI